MIRIKIYRLRILSLGCNFLEKCLDRMRNKLSNKLKIKLNVVFLLKAKPNWDLNLI